MREAQVDHCRTLAVGFFFLSSSHQFDNTTPLLGIVEGVEYVEFVAMSLDSEDKDKYSVLRWFSAIEFYCMLKEYL